MVAYRTFRRGSPRGQRNRGAASTKGRAWPYSSQYETIVSQGHEQPTPTVEDLQLHVRGLLAHFKTPAIVEFTDELPRNAAGKVLRRKLL